MGDGRRLRREARNEKQERRDERGETGDGVGRQDTLVGGG